MKLDSFEVINNGGGVVQLDIFGRIGDYWGVTDELIAYQLEAAGEVSTINLRISTEGGSAKHGATIYSLLKNHAATVNGHVYGACMSAGVHILMACDNIAMEENALLMIHRTALSPGDSMTAEELIAASEMVTEVDKGLVAVLAARTGLDNGKVGELLDATTYMAADRAKELGFIDEIVPAKQAEAGVTNLAEFIDGLPPAFRNIAASWKPDNVPAPVPKPGKKEPNMEPATIQELRENCTGADDSFILGQLENKSTILDAMKAWTAEQSNRLTAAAKAKDEAVNKAKAEAEQAAKDKLEQEAKDKLENNGGQGNNPHPTNNQPSGSSNDFMSLVDDLRQSNDKLSRTEAVRIVAKRNPEAHQRFLLATNDGSRLAKRQLSEKYDMEQDAQKAAAEAN